MYRKNLVFAAACLAILFFGMAITTLGSVLPDLRLRFQLSEVDAGTLFSILPFGLLSGSLLFGPFSDRYGYKIMLCVALACMFAGFEGIAFSSSWLLLNISVFLFGLGGGAINGGTSALVSDISETGKGANLSILGVFFSVGALGMPFILGLLRDHFNYQTVISLVGAATFLAMVFYLFIRFPPAKISGVLPVKEGLAMLKSPLLLMVAFFLFFQSAFEGIINNWTPTYLTERVSLPLKNALFALSLSVVGMAVMRVLLGTVFRNTRSKFIWLVSLCLMLPGLLFLNFATTFIAASFGLILIGGALAAGFPIMLGVVGNLYRKLSGTAFSVVFVIALFGNMAINYALGFIVQRFGVEQVITVCFISLAIMSILCLSILRRQGKEGIY